MTAIIRASGEAGPDGRWEWLRVIHAANTIDPTMFGEPISTGPWWAGGYVEEYEHARVVIDDDRSARIVALTEHGETILRQVGKDMGIGVSGE